MNTTQTKEIINKSVNDLVNFVKPTYGPASHKVIIQNAKYRMVVDDGVQIAKDYKSDDVYEQAVIELIRDVALSTNRREGDGTTGSLILLQAIMNYVHDNDLYNRASEQEIKTALIEAKEQIEKQAVKITKIKDLEKVARISFDDETIAKLIAKTWKKMGKNGVVSVEKSPTNETYVDMVDGIKIDSGALSPYLPNKMEDVRVFVSDYTLSQTQDVQKLAQLISAGNNNGSPIPTVIIADGLESHALEFLVYNLQQGQLHFTFIPLPKNDKGELVNDISTMTGASKFTSGNKPSGVTLDDLGEAEKFYAKEDYCVLEKPQGDEEEIKALAKKYKDDGDAKRLAFVENKIATIKVGAETGNEQVALRFKIDDAVNAVRSAYLNGVVPGGGFTLKNITTSSPILNQALQAPNKELSINSDYKFINDEVTNVVTGESGDFLDVGVADPLNTVVAGLESAVSIAGLLMTTKGIISEVENVEK